MPDIFGNPSPLSPQLHDAESAIEVTGGVEAIESIEVSVLPRWVFRVFMLALSGVALLFAGRALVIQVVDGAHNQARARGNSIDIVITPAERGLITDRNGAVLAQNDRRVGVSLNPKLLPRTKDAREAVYEKLTSLGLLTDELRETVEKARTSNPQPVALRTIVTEEENLLWREALADVGSIEFTELPVRKYADLSSWGQLVGFTGSVTKQALEAGAPRNARVGREGLEAVYERVLSGTPGKQYVEVNASGTVVRQLSTPENTPSITGSTLKLGLDSGLQNAVAAALRDELQRRTERYGALPNLGASAVVLDPRSGVIRAMVSLPDYPSSTFAQGVGSEAYAALTIDASKPLFNRATLGVYAPGSTLKPLVAAAGLAEGIIGPNTVMNTPDAIVIGSSRFPDWKPHGQTNTRKAIAESNNIFFSALGGGWEERNFKGLGIDTMNRYLARFGLGTTTGIDLVSESGGLLPTPEWKQRQFNERWFIGNTYQAAIGQGFLLATPLQMAAATAAIANGGTFHTPHLAESFTTADGSEQKVTTPSREVGVSTQALQVVREGMRQAVTEGSARLLNGLSVSSAGKTGTAQFGNQGLTHAWFTGFAPYENPEIAFAVVIEGGGESFYSSVPVAEGILRAAFNEPLQPGETLLSAPSAARQQEIAAEFSGER